MQEKFLIRYPEFEEVDSEMISLFFSDAANSMNKRRWGARYEEGLCALVAHKLYMRGVLDGDHDGSPVKDVASESADGLSISYGGVDRFADSKGSYALSSYGQTYLDLRAKLPPAGFVLS